MLPIINSFSFPAVPDIHASHISVAFLLLPGKNFFIIPLKKWGDTLTSFLFGATAYLMGSIIVLYLYSRIGKARLKKEVSLMAEITMYGADWCQDCRRAKAFLNDREIPFTLIEIDKHEWAAQKMEELNNGKRRIPTLIIDETVLSNPDNAILAKVLKLAEGFSPCAPCLREMYIYFRNRVLVLCQGQVDG